VSRTPRSFSEFLMPSMAMSAPNESTGQAGTPHSSNLARLMGR
jgi:hypothetical protein